MKALSRSLAAAGIALFGWAGAAQAAPVVADFTGPQITYGAAVNPVFDLGGGLSVTVSASDHSGSSGADAPFDGFFPMNIYRNDEGLGVYGGVPDNIDLDGSGGSDLLRFTFNQTVTLLSTLFENVAADEFDMSVDGVDIDVVALLGSDDLDLLPNGGFGDDSNLAEFPGEGLTGTVFDFYTNNFDDDYRIRQLVVETLAGDGDGGKDVSEPAALLLLGMALASFCLARHRRC